MNWPVNIILTPPALKIYAEIFNFLIKVKLAVFSLTDSWCLLKVYTLIVACLLSVYLIQVVQDYAPVSLFKAHISISLVLM